MNFQQYKIRNNCKNEKKEIEINTGTAEFIVPPNSSMIQALELESYIFGVMKLSEKEAQTAVELLETHIKNFTF